MTQPEREQSDEKGESGTPKSLGKDVLGRSDFVRLTAAVITVAITGLVAVYTTISTWTVILVSAGILIALAVNFKGLSQARWFSASVPWMLSAVLVIGGITITAARNAPRAHGSANLPKPQPSPRVIAHIRFIEPRPHQKVPQCPRITLAGVIPRGMSLWIMVVPNINYGADDYWYGQIAADNGLDVWSAREVSIGSRSKSVGFHARLYVVLMDSIWARYFNQVLGAAGSLQVSALPPGEVVAGPLPVTRGPDPRKPSCPTS